MQEGSGSIYGITGTQRAAQALAATKAAGEEVSAVIGGQQTETDDRLESQNITIAIRQKKLLRPTDARSIERTKRVQGSIFIRKGEADELADQFSGRQGNKEYHLDPRLLSHLAEEELGVGIDEETSPDKIIEIIQNRMTVQDRVPDVSIVDKAFEFLIEVAEQKLKNAATEDKPRISKMLEHLTTGKNKHLERHKIDIEVAQKIIGAVDAVSRETGMDLSEVLGLYRNRIHNPPDLQTLRKYYEEKGYKFMKLELKGFSSFVGKDFKRKDLENAELNQLAQSVRQMQALLGVVRQAKNRCPIMEHYLEVNGILSNESAAAA